MWFDRYIPFEIALRDALPIGTYIKHSSCEPEIVREFKVFTPSMYTDILLQSTCSVSCDNIFLAFRTVKPHTIRYVVETVRLHFDSTYKQFSTVVRRLIDFGIVLKSELCIHLEFTEDGYIVAFRDSAEDNCFYTHVSHSLPCSNTLSSIKPILDSAVDDAIYEAVMRQQ